MTDEPLLPARPWLPADQAIATRRAIRGFLSTPVPMSHVKHLLSLASRAPSGSNIQPWNVRVLAGEAKTRLTAAILRTLPDDPAQRPKADWDYYPVKWREPYIGRRRKLGWSLYGLMGIGKGDTEAAEAFRRRNYDFFGAPVGMIFTLDVDLEVGSWLDFGIFLGELMIAARGAGLDTCPQQSFADVHAVVHAELDIPDTQKVICGMALGYADNAAVPNRLVTEREPVERFATFAGFEDA